MPEIPLESAQLSAVLSAFRDEAGRRRTQFPNIPSGMLYQEALEAALERTQSMLVPRRIGVGLLPSGQGGRDNLVGEEHKERDDSVERLKHIELTAISVAEADALRNARAQELRNQISAALKSSGPK